MSLLPFLSLTKWGKYATINKNFDIPGISLHIYGYGKVEWYDQSKKKKKTGRPDYTGTEEYLSMNTNLVQAENGKIVYFQSNLV